MSLYNSISAIVSLTQAVTIHADSVAHHDIDDALVVVQKNVSALLVSCKYLVEETCTLREMEWMGKIGMGMYESIFQELGILSELKETRGFKESVGCAELEMEMGFKKSSKVAQVLGTRHV